MKELTWATSGRFILWTFAVLIADSILRALFLGTAPAELGGSDVVIAMAVATMIEGGWLKRSQVSSE